MKTLVATSTDRPTLVLPEVPKQLTITKEFRLEFGPALYHLGLPAYVSIETECDIMQIKPALSGFPVHGSSTRPYIQDKALMSYTGKYVVIYTVVDTLILRACVY